MLYSLSLQQYGKALRIRMFLIRMGCCVLCEGTASHSANKLVRFCYHYYSVREQKKLVDLPLVIADRRHAILGHIISLPEEASAHAVLQYVINVTKGSHPATGWKRPPGRPEIMATTSRCGSGT